MIVQRENVNFTPSGAISKYLRVKLNGSNNLATAAAEEVEVGTTAQEVHSDDNVAAVVPRNAMGSRKMVASASFSKGDRLYGADGGKVSNAANGNPRGYALEAASGDGSIVEVLPDEVMQKRLEGANSETLSGNKTLSTTDKRTQALDPGGSGRDVNLPAEGEAAGLDFFVVNTADGAEVLTVKDDGGNSIVTPTQNETAYVWCDGSSWRGMVGDNN